LIGWIARAARAVTVDAGLLRRRREYRLLIAGQAISDLGSMITLVAIPVQAFKITGSSVAVGLLGVAEFVPILVLALVGGALADAFDRRRLVMLAEVGALLVVSGLVVNSALPDPKLWVLYVAAALIAACTAIRRPPLDALMPRLVERDELKAASALQWAVHNIAHMLGPALGGVLIATGAQRSPTAPTSRRSRSRSWRSRRCARRRRPSARRSGSTRSPRACATPARARS
jgi:MFS family permease